jgi:hypothetical protein
MIMAKRKKTVKAPAPSRRGCGCVQAHFGLLDTYPEFRANQGQIEQFTRHYLQAGDFAARASMARIPVVVHVVYRTSDENVSDAQVKRQIAVLNRDFRARNGDKSKVPDPFKDLVADARIEFTLATKDPDGKKCKGITHTRTHYDSFSHLSDDVKSSATGGVDPWDTSKYLNIWVCTLSNILGYAQFPGGPKDTDGAVILNTAFGTAGTARAPFDKGRTTTHEIGHYLNLSHIWGESRIPTCEDTDYVGDTPNQFDKNFGAPTFPHISCSNAPHGDMFMNYMDYVDDAAMFMFTHGQAKRMQATLAGPRMQLVDG